MVTSIYSSHPRFMVRCGCEKPNIVNLLAKSSAGPTTPKLGSTDVAFTI
jgi:hypothetical protein